MKPFLSGRPTAPVAALKPIVNALGERSAPPSRSRPAPVEPTHDHRPSVECVKQGDKVTHLIVTCACGERIEIDCLYAGPA